MNKLLATLVVLAGLSGQVRAEGIVLTEEPKVIHTVGPVQIYNPLLSPRAVYYYDLRAKESLLGGELPILKLWVLEGTFGLATNVTHPDSANPMLGMNLALPNPLPAWASLDQIKPGLAGGYNLERQEAVAALKAAISFGS